MPLINIPNRESASSNTSECSEDAIKNVPEDVQYGPLKSKSIVMYLIVLSFNSELNHIFFIEGFHEIYRL